MCNHHTRINIWESCVVNRRTTYTHGPATPVCRHVAGQETIAGVGHAAAGGTAAGATLRDNLGGGSDAFGGFSLAGLVRARSMVVVIHATVTSNV